MVVKRKGFIFNTSPTIILFILLLLHFNGLNVKAGINSCPTPRFGINFPVVIQTRQGYYYPGHVRKDDTFEILSGSGKLNIPLKDTLEVRSAKDFICKTVFFPNKNEIICLERTGDDDDKKMWQNDLAKRCRKNIKEDVVKECTNMILDNFKKQDAVTLTVMDKREMPSYLDFNIAFHDATPTWKQIESFWLCYSMNSAWTSTWTLPICRRQKCDNGEEMIIKNKNCSFTFPKEEWQRLREQEDEKITRFTVWVEHFLIDGFRFPISGKLLIEEVELYGESKTPLSNMYRQPYQFLRALPHSHVRWSRCQTLRKNICDDKKELRIFVYGMEDEFKSKKSKLFDRWTYPKASIPLRNFEVMYSAEQIIIERLMCSTQRTADPKEADLFYVPFSQQWYMHHAGKKKSFPGGNEWFSDGIQFLLSDEGFAKEFSYSKGDFSDHIFSAVNDIGNCVATSVPEVFRNAIFLTHFGDLRKSGRVSAAKKVNEVNAANEVSGGEAFLKECGYEHGKDIVIPPYSGNINRIEKVMKRKQDWNEKPILQRTIFVFFQGSVHHVPLRRTMINEFKDDPKFHVKAGFIAPILYFEYLANSIFCLAPPGHQQWTPRIAQALLAGCIPVIIEYDDKDCNTPLNKYENVHPWEKRIDYDSFSIRTRSCNIGRLREKLLNIPKNKIQQMQEEGKKIRHFFKWSQNTNLNEHLNDAFTMLLDHLATKAQSLKTCTVPYSPQHKTKNQIIFNDYKDGINRVEIKMKISSSIENKVTIFITTFDFKKYEHELCVSQMTMKTKEIEKFCIPNHSLQAIASSINSYSVTVEMKIKSHLSQFIIINAFVQGRLSQLVLRLQSGVIAVNEEGNSTTNPETELNFYFRNKKINIIKQIKTINHTKKWSRNAAARLQMLSNAFQQGGKKWMQNFKEYKNMFTIDVIIFSKDRPSEADALLQSMRRYTKGIAKVWLLYDATRECHEKGYQLVAKHFEIELMNQNFIGGFKKGTLKILEKSNATHIIPVVGEVLAIRKHDLKEAAAWLEIVQPRGVMNIRLGTHFNAFKKLQKLKEKKEIKQFVIAQGQQYLLYDTLAVSQNGCHKEEAFLNHFWWVTHINGMLAPTWILNNLWPLLQFQHPGELEVSFGKAKPTKAALPNSRYKRNKINKDSIGAQNNQHQNIDAN
eukprot:g3681.t1